MANTPVPRRAGWCADRECRDAAPSRRRAGAGVTLPFLMPRPLAFTYLARGLLIWALIRIVATIGVLMMRTIDSGARSGTMAPLLLASAVCIVDFRRRRESPGSGGFQSVCRGLTPFVGGRRSLPRLGR